MPCGGGGAAGRGMQVSEMRRRMEKSEESTAKAWRKMCCCLRHCWLQPSGACHQGPRSSLWLNVKVSEGH